MPCYKQSNTTPRRYFWRFKGSGRLPAQPKATHPKPVQQLDMATGKVVATFASQSEAERALNVSAGNISSVCHGTYAKHNALSHPAFIQLGNPDGGDATQLSFP